MNAVMVDLLLLGVLAGYFSQGMQPARPTAQADQAKLAKEFTNSVGMNLVRIEPGKFMMGSTATEIARVKKESKSNGYDNEGPAHVVEITSGFHMGIYPVTQAQYRRVMGANPSWFSAEGGGKDDVAGISTDDFPVEMVSWSDANLFCRKLSQLEGKTYRMPTEAEWEYACRAGTKTQFGKGDGEEALREVGWYAANSGMKTQRVGQLAANAWGLFDMHGNVCQWCEDWHESTYYEISPKTDPVGPAIGECRVLRGGSWQLTAPACRSAARLYGRHDNRDNDCGFRVVLVSKR